MNTIEEREKKVREALAISSLGAKEPTKECVELLKDYVEGKSTVDENKEKIIERYKKKHTDQTV